ncbi:MAG: AAA family ATPase [Casimicrobium sp.]
MPPIAQHQTSKNAKILLIGSPGAGKTGAMISLAKAGYKIKMLDLDNGVEILSNLSDAKMSIEVETVTETYKSSVGKAMPTGGAFPKVMKLLDAWPVEWDADGKVTKTQSITSFGPDTVFVVDSLTRLGQYAMDYVLSLNSRLGQQPQIQDWGAAMTLQEGLLKMLSSSALKCHVIVCSHVKFLESEENQAMIGLPNALGKQLPTFVGSYFNSTLFVKTRGIGAGLKRLIFTKSPGIVDTKTPAPNSVKSEYPQDSGLAEYFKDLGFSPSPLS